mmetsp:Transcript_19546/g.44482  ORF Transcript_19546/g.44482 Transcript_19546/m.44482 type:complete len:229 (+) Transcript_19546:25-711(+)
MPSSPFTGFRTAWLCCLCVRAVPVPQGTGGHLEVELQPGGQVQKATPTAAGPLLRSEPLEPAAPPPPLPGPPEQPEDPRLGLAPALVSVGADGTAVAETAADSAAAASLAEVQGAVGAEPLLAYLRTSENASLLDADGNFLPVVGINNAADVAYKANDLLMGASGIIDEDYPFMCLCTDEGKCKGDNTTCTGRAGSGSGARRAAQVGFARAAGMLAFVASGLLAAAAA